MTDTASRQRVRGVLVFAVAMLGAGCGTAVFQHRIDVTINDPAGKLGPPPIDVSIFDHLMGYSEEWGRRALGPSSPTRPYSGTLSATAGKMFYDTSPPTRVDAGLVIPAYRKDGYFLIDVEPKAGTEQSAALPFVAWNEYFPDRNQPPPTLPVRFRSEVADKGWLIHLTIDVPK